jgi:hypothetical protein
MIPTALLDTKTAPLNVHPFDETLFDEARNGISCSSPPARLLSRHITFWSDDSGSGSFMLGRLTLTLLVFHAAEKPHRQLLSLKRLRRHLTVFKG